MKTTRLTAFYSVGIGFIALLTLVYLFNQLQQQFLTNPIDLTLLFQVAIGIAIILGIIGLRHYRHLNAENLQLKEDVKQQIRHLKREHNIEKNRLSVVLDSSRLAYWEWDIKKNQAYFSPLWQEMIGFHDTQFPQELNAWQSRIHPIDQEKVQKQLLQILAGKLHNYENTHRLMTADGDYIWVYDRGQVLTNTEGDIKKLSCVRLDITQQKQTEQELTLDKTLLEHTQEAIVISDDDYRIIRTNPAFHALFGFSKDEAEKLSLKQLLDNLQDENAEDVLAIVNQQNAWRGELNLHHQNGDLARSTLVDIQKIFYSESQTTHFAVVCTDITQLKQTQKELSFLANTDMVTGLPNRNHFYQVLTDTFKKFEDSNQNFTVMFLDLDNFKTVNDTLGHDIGDHLLKSVSDAISENLAEDTLFARVGGDEFVILCQAYTTPEQLNVVGKTLNDLISQPFEIGEHKVQVGSSVGIAIYPQHGTDQETLLKHADQAMYEAKNSGKGQFKIYQTW